MFPYLDFAGFTRRTPMPLGDINVVEAKSPGYTVQRIAVAQSYINARLRKRYGAGRKGNALPLGQGAPALEAVGTSPPEVSLSGRPVLGSSQFLIQITSPGGLGAAIFQWSADNGQTWTTNVTTNTTVVLGSSGVTANFPVANYSADNQYASATAVPEAVLGWMVALVTVDLYLKRGVNPQDPVIEMYRGAADKALAELKEAADSKDGLFDLPTADDGDSAVTTGGPLGYTETSPYEWTDKQARRGKFEDGGRGGGNDNGRGGSVL